MTTAEHIKITVGDSVTWRGPRNYGYREIRGKVMHVGKIFVRVRSGHGGSQDSWLRHREILSASPSLPVS